MLYSDFSFDTGTVWQRTKVPSLSPCQRTRRDIDGIGYGLRIWSTVCATGLDDVSSGMLPTCPLFQAKVLETEILHLVGRFGAAWRNINEFHGFKAAWLKNMKLYQNGAIISNCIKWCNATVAPLGVGNYFFHIRETPPKIRTNVVQKVRLLWKQRQYGLMPGESSARTLETDASARKK